MERLNPKLPRIVLEKMKEQYRRVQPIDPEDFEDLGADEDSLTGALGKTMRRELTGREGKIHWSTRVKKLRGRGPGAPENRFGADFIIEIEVKEKGGDIVWRKGLLGQSKKLWTGRDSTLLGQVQAMESVVGGGSIVLDYRPEGCYAVSGRKTLEAEGNRRMVSSDDVLQVGPLLADQFLECLVGRVDMYYDATRELVVLPAIASHMHVATRIRTSVEGV